MIHFIYPVTDKTRPWSVVNTLAVKLARKHNPDAEIIVWTNKSECVPDIHAKSIKVRQVPMPTSLGGVEITRPQYIADVFRLQTLNIYGGVYMDTDILSLRPVCDMIGEKLIISWETDAHNSICNALMITQDGNIFIEEWLSQMPFALQSQLWAYPGVVLPAMLTHMPHLQEHRKILPHTFACPLDLTHNWLFQPSLKEEAKKRITESHAVHGFETYWRDYITTGNGCLFDELSEGVSDGTA